ncbi:MAG: DUF3095 domain-containing protein [Albidovulum sp.]
MDLTDETEFLANLPQFDHFEGVADLSLYQALPNGWALGLADIVDSTGAIAAGRYKSVNMAGASVITAIINALDRYDLPFVFGGDGAFVAIPPSGFDAAERALSQVQSWVAREFGLDMRAAVVPVTDIRAASVDVRVARFRVSSEMSYAMFAGDGASWAEDSMKKGLYAVAKAPADAEPDLKGLSCRWSPISSRHGKIVSVIAVPGDGGNSPEFRKLISEIITLVDQEDRSGHPVPAEGPQPGISLHSIDAEALTKAQTKPRLLRRIEMLGIAVMFAVFRKFNWKLGAFDFRAYSRDVSLNTDFRKFDDALKMTLDLDANHLAKLEMRLQAAEMAGVCRYGVHLQDEALMTCIVPSPMTRDHMHFVDGAAGGYAEAASHLKRKIKAADAQGTRN